MNIFNGAHFGGTYFGEEGKHINVNMELLFFKEDNVFIIYAPSLDLTGYGKSPEEAQQSFVVILDEFFKYTLKKKTFFKELERLGWKKAGTKKKPQYKPPYLDTLFAEREYLKEIVREKDFEKYTQTLAMPA